MNRRLLKAWGAGLLSLFLVIGSYSHYQNKEPVSESYPVELSHGVKKARIVPINKEAICSSNTECKILAEAVYYEARGESHKGMIGVAHVILNRAKSKGFPDTIEGVIKHRCQFSYRCDGSTKKGIQESEAWKKSLRIAYDVIEGKTEDPTNGADHYANPSKVAKPYPRWMRVYERVAVIDNHHFYRR